MKKHFNSVMAAAVIIVSACNKNDETANNRFRQSLDSIDVILNERDSTINNLLSSYNEIEENLDSIAAKQNIISLAVEQKGDSKSNRNSRINTQIDAINKLMEHNREKIEELNRKVKSYSLKINQFNKMISNLNDQISEKNLELASLNDKLNLANAEVAQLHIFMDTLANTNISQSKTIAAQTASMHTAYYLVGKSKDLETMNVIDKTGGLLGIGKTSKLNSNFDKNVFKRIDYTQVMNIPINSKKAKLITAHPTDSYSLEKENDEYTNLKITQPEKFWGTSKYLVVIN